MKDGKFVILCVDDDQDTRTALRLILEKEGYLVLTAASAQDGLRACQEAAPDLAILDLMMDQIDSGTQMVGQLRAAGIQAPIYMLSAVGDQLGQTIEAGQLGLAGVFQKPIDGKALVSTIRAHLGPR